MFQESLVESTNLLRTYSRWPALASIATQAILVAIFLAIPLLHPEALVFTQSKLTRLTPPALRPVPPPPPPQILRVATSSLNTPTLAPPTLARQLPPPSSVTDATPVPTALMPMGIPGTPGTLPFNIAEASGDSSPHVVLAAGPSGSGDTRGPLHLSTGVTAGMLVDRITPIYPPIARISRTEGVVIVQAIISKSGRIESAHAVSGPPMLQAAAVAAVQQARYRPYLLNGLPTEVETTVTINFKLGS